MTWTKLSDDFSDDAWDLSDAAFRLHVEGHTWSNRKLLDLHISPDDLRRFAKHPDAVDELVAKGFWEVDVERGGYVILHHGSYQATSEQVIRRQAANRQNGQKGGRPVNAATGKPYGPHREGPPKPPTFEETHSVSEPLSEDGTHRDGPGRKSSEDDETNSLTQWETQLGSGWGDTEIAAIPAGMTGGFDPDEPF